MSCPHIIGHRTTFLIGTSSAESFGLPTFTAPRSWISNLTPYCRHRKGAAKSHPLPTHRALSGATSVPHNRLGPSPSSIARPLCYTMGDLHGPPSPSHLRQEATNVAARKIRDLVRPNATPALLKKGQIVFT